MRQAARGTREIDGIVQEWKSEEIARYFRQEARRVYLRSAIFALTMVVVLVIIADIIQTAG